MSEPTDETVELAVPNGAVYEDPQPPTNGYRVPLWVTLALATVAVVALGVAFAAFNTARQLQDDVAAFQGELFSSGELAAGTLNSTSAGLSTLVDQPFTFTARVDQEVPIVASVPFNRTIVVPIRTSVPINETIETTITVAGPFGWDVPVDVTVPIVLDLPVDLSVPIEIDEVIDVDTTTHLQLDVPVELDLEESGLALLVRQMSSNLTRLANSIPTPG